MWSVFLSALTAFALTATAALADETSYTVTKDVPFGDLPRQLLDIYTPDTVTDDTPVLVFLFGGSFSFGDKGDAYLIGQVFAKAGVIVVTPNYRTYPEASFPGFIEDAAKAIAHSSQTLRTSTGAPRPIVVSGWSSGAYIGSMVSYDGRYLVAEGVPPSTVSGFIGLAGPYWGGLCAGRSCPQIFPPDTEADWPVADFVDRDDPPMLLVQGTADSYVDFGNFETLGAAGEAAGLEVTTLVLENGYHKLPMSRMGEQGSEVHDAAEAFIARATAR